MIRTVRMAPPVEVIDDKIVIGELKRRTHQRHLHINEEHHYPA